VVLSFVSSSATPHPEKVARFKQIVTYEHDALQLLEADGGKRSARKGGPGNAAIAQPMLSRILRLKSCRISGASCSGRAAAAKAAMRSTAERVSCPG
jgi:hypothetical protein